jgi:hypothetical protein
VSSVTSAQRVESRAFSDRLLSVLPLLTVYAWLCTVYLVEVWGRLTPWLFVDELKMTQLARAIAEHGHPGQRGQPVSPTELYAWLIAPLWLIHHVPDAYAAVKYLNVFVMASVVFPTYFLARLVVGKRAALFAAAGAGAVPSLAYTGYVVEENLAYPYAALCFFLTAKALVTWRTGRTGLRWAIGAVLALLVAPLVRGELAVLPACAALSAAFMWWTSEGMRTRRRSWSVADYLGIVALAFGAIFVFSGIMSHVSNAWLVATAYQHRMLNMLGWAAGALAVGCGVVPLVGGLAALVGPRGEVPEPEVRAVRSLTLAAMISFGLYTAVKAAYLSAVFATRVEERNLVYVTPLLFVGTAVLFERRRVRAWALGASAALATYLVVYAVYHPTQFPYEMNVQLYSDALGLAILQQGNRYLAWTPEFARWLLLGISIGGTCVLVVITTLRSRARLVAGLAVVLAAGVVGWSLTGQIAAATGGNSIGRSFAQTLSPKGGPFTWVDDVAGGRATLYQGVGEADQIPEWLLEFWNRSIVSVGSLDGTVDGPGPTSNPNIGASGKLYWTVSPRFPGRQYDFAVEDSPCVDFAGKVAASWERRAGGRLEPWRLIELTKPNRLDAMCTGIYPDGWTGSVPSSYYRFSHGRGRLRVVVSRRDWGGPTPPSPVHLLLARVVNGPDKQPAIGKVLKRFSLAIGSSQTKTVWLRTPLERFAVKVVVDKKFSPHDYLPAGSPGSSDLRTLGAEVSYRFFPARS